MRRSLLLLMVLAIGAALWLLREHLLRGLEELWVVSDPVGPADAVVVLGGGLDTRPYLAAEYYRNGLTSKVLLANVRRSNTEKLGIAPSHTNLNQRVLTHLGVPESAIETFGNDLSSTYEEGIALRSWALDKHAQSIIVPTEYFSARRVHWILAGLMEGTGTRVQVPAVKDPDFPSDWWKDDKAILVFQNEVLKYVYYRLKY